MIHKYNANGLLQLVQHAVNDHPDLWTTLQILKFYPSAEWMNSRVQRIKSA